MTNDEWTPDLAAETRADCDRRLERLGEGFDEVPVRSDTVENDPDYFRVACRLAREGVLYGAGAWVEDEDGRALLIRHEGSEEWGPPAGSHEPDEETLAETARREVFEETGVAVELTGVWFVRDKTIRHRDHPDRRVHMLSAWFEAAPADDATIDLDPDRWEPEEEIAEARWFESPPDRVAERFRKRVGEWARE